MLSPDGSWCQPCPGAWIPILFLGNQGVPVPKCFLLCLGHKSVGNGLRKVLSHPLSGSNSWLKVEKNDYICHCLWSYQVSSASF